MARPNQDERQTQGSRGRGEEKPGGRSSVKDDHASQRRTGEAGNSKTSREAGMNAKRDGATGRERSPRDDQDQNEQGPDADALEEERGYQKGRRDETKANPNRAW
jgi:hypothetical protein